MAKTTIVVLSDDPKVARTLGSEIAALLDSLHVGYSWQQSPGAGAARAAEHELMVERIASKLDLDLITAVAK